MAELTGTKVNIYNKRIEELPAEKVDVITSRALTALDNLLNYASRFAGLIQYVFSPKEKNMPKKSLKQKNTGILTAGLFPAAKATKASS